MFDLVGGRCALGADFDFAAGLGEEHGLQRPDNVFRLAFHGDYSPGAVSGRKFTLETA